MDFEVHSKEAIEGTLSYRYGDGNQQRIDEIEAALKEIGDLLCFDPIKGWQLYDYRVEEVNGIIIKTQH